MTCLLFAGKLTNQSLSYQLHLQIEFKLIPGNHICGKCSSLRHLDATTTFELFFKSVELSTFTPEEKQEYQRNMTSELDIKNQIAYAHMEGLAEGKAEGLAVGEAKVKAEVARRMLERDFPVGMVAEVTGFSEAEIMALRQDG